MIDGLIPYGDRGPVIPFCVPGFSRNWDSYKQIPEPDQWPWRMMYYAPALAIQFRLAVEEHFLPLTGWIWRGYREFPFPPHKETQRGICNVCGHLILKKDGRANTSRSYHQECWHQFHMMESWELTMRLVRQRDKVCQMCGEAGAEVDHERELFDHREDITVHFLQNLRLLCTRCHGIKSGASRRARNAAARPEISTQSIFQEKT